MLLKPVTALALSALISFVASTAVAAPATSSDGKVTPTSLKGHHGKKTTKQKKKLGHLAYDHSVEPKSSPKLAASMSQPLDIKKAADKGPSSKKATISATGKEVYIGGPVAHGSGSKMGKPSVAVKPSPVHASGKLALGKSHVVGKSLSLKSGREPSHAESVAKNDSAEQSIDEHPAPVLVAEHDAKSFTGDIKPGAPVPAPCSHEPVELVRGAEIETFALTSCKGGLAPLAEERLSVLVRPESAARPVSTAGLAKVTGVQIAPGIRRVDPGLVERLQLIADHFAKPGAPTRVSIVSGYRPESTGSFHATAQALDFHIDGVPNEALVEFCKTLENTGCGYYPNSSFVHVDVRAPGTGHVAWIDASGPGEPARYVATWPPPPEPNVNLAEVDADMANPYKELLQAPGAPIVKEAEKAPPATMNTPLKLKDWE
jgi:hypothetical protein